MVERCQLSQLDASAIEERSGSDEDRIRSLPTIAAKAASISALVLALWIWSCSPIERAAAFTSLNSAGLASGRIRSDAGRPGQQISKHFQSLCSQLGTGEIDSGQVAARSRERLVAKPSSTGSAPTTKTMGIVVVAAFAAIED